MKRDERHKPAPKYGDAPKGMGRGRVQLNILLTIELDQALSDLTFRKQMRPSELMREALAQYVERENAKLDSGEKEGQTP